MDIHILTIAILLMTVVSSLTAVPYFDDSDTEDDYEVNAINSLANGIDKRYYGKPFPRRRYSLSRKMCIRRNQSCAFLGRNQCCSGTCRCRFFSSNCYCKGKGLFQRWG